MQKGQQCIFTDEILTRTVPFPSQFGTSSDEASPVGLGHAPARVPFGVLRCVH